MGNFRFLTLLAAAPIFGFLGRPDLVLTTLITAVFFLDFWLFSLVALAALLLLKSDTGLEKDLLLLLALVFTAFGLRRLLPWRRLLNYLFLLFAATFSWPLLSGGSYIVSALIFNLALGMLLYFSFRGPFH